MDRATKNDQASASALASESKLAAIENATPNLGTVGLPRVSSVPEKKAEIYFQIED